jgi:hypothetical protein
VLNVSSFGTPGGLHRGGAIFFEGTLDCVVSNCTFERLDGNGVMVSGYNRNATVQDSEFSWLGHSAAAAWGYTNGMMWSDKLSGARIHLSTVRTHCYLQRKTALMVYNHTSQTLFATTFARLGLSRNSRVLGFKPRLHSQMSMPTSSLTGVFPLHVGRPVV